MKYPIYLLIFSLLIVVGCSSSREQDQAMLWETAVSLNKPTGLATDSQNNLYIVDSGNHRIVKLNPNGELIATWGQQGSSDGEFNFYFDNGTVCGIAIDVHDHVFVVDKGNFRIQKFDRNGRFLTSWGSQGTGEGQFVRPIYVATDTAGNVYVTDDRNPIVQKFDGNGRFLTSWGSFGNGDGQFQHATGIAVDLDGFVYVSDYKNRRVQKFDGNGRFITAWSTTHNGKAGIPEAIAVTTTGHIAITDSKLKQLLIYDNNGILASASPIPGGTLFKKLLPYGLAMNNQGNIFISNRDQNQLILFKK